MKLFNVLPHSDRLKKVLQLSCKRSVRGNPDTTRDGGIEGRFLAKLFCLWQTMSFFGGEKEGGDSRLWARVASTGK